MRKDCIDFQKLTNISDIRVKTLNDILSLGKNFKLIGQCKECWYYKESHSTAYINKQFRFYCKNNNVKMKYPKQSFGCWYWKAKKK